MNILSINQLGKSFSEKWLFRNISFGVEQGEKIALIGKNGIGKSTLLRIIAGKETAEEGEVAVRNELKMAYLEQHPVFSPHLSIWKTIFETESPSIRAIREYEDAMLDPSDSDKLQKALEKMDDAQAWDFESKIKEILGKLQIENIHQSVSTLSGGQLKRLAIAKILLQEPDFIILDEPTNHLDLEIIEWLEQYLANQKKSLLLVTHDRYFLDKVCNKIIEIDQSKIYPYQGNYGYFLEKKAERMLTQQAQTDKARQLMTKELDWIRRQPKARGTKAKYRVDNFEVLKEKASQTVSNAKLQIGTEMSRQGKKIIELEHVQKSFGTKNIIDDFNYVFKKSEKIGIIGKNGVGKSTFLNILTGTDTPDSGNIDKGLNTVFGYYTQQESLFDPTLRLIEIVNSITDNFKVDDKTTANASQLLTRFGFPPEKQYSLAGTLSGGEKKRLQLLLVLVQKPNFLILDEPTNDLDIDTLNILEDYLQEFEGCLIIVSHDRYFMDRLTDHLFIFEGNGKIRDFSGNYSDYRSFLEEQKQAETKAVRENKVVESSKSLKTKLSFKEKQEYEQLEKQIAEAESKKTLFMDKLNGKETDHSLLTEWSQKIDELDREIEQKMERWLELDELA